MCLSGTSSAEAKDCLLDNDLFCHFVRCHGTAMACMWRAEDKIGCQSLPPTLFGRESYVCHRICQASCPSGLWDSTVSTSPSLCCRQTKITNAHSITSVFEGPRGAEPRSPFSYSKCFTHRAISVALANESCGGLLGTQTNKNII